MELSSLLLVEEYAGDAELEMAGLRSQGFGMPIEHLESADDAKALLEGLLSKGGELPAGLIVSVGEEKDGDHEFIRWVRRQPRLYSLPIVVIGTLARMSNVSEAYAAGANAFFTKGSDFSALARTLRGAF
jgi:CheY-like chemotaxis protein